MLQNHFRGIGLFVLWRKSLQKLTVLRILGLVLLMIIASTSSQAAEQNNDIVFVGSIDTENKAAIGWITFVLTENGTKIKEIAWSMKDVKYDGGISKEYGVGKFDEIKLTNGEKKFSTIFDQYDTSSVKAINSIEGEFISAEEAEGLLRLEKTEVVTEKKQNIKLTGKDGTSMQSSFASFTSVNLGVMKWKASIMKPTPEKLGLGLLLQIEKQ